MATLPAPGSTGLSYQDLLAFPEDNYRRELIDGELIVTPAPTTRHQRVVISLAARLWAYAQEHGGEALAAPTDVFFGDRDVVEPDVLYVTAEHLARVELPFVRGAPDIVIEVSSSSTRKIDLGRKRDLYARDGVLEYWFVDLDAGHIEVYRRKNNEYGVPLILSRSDRLTSPQLPGFDVAVVDVLGADRVT
jgi:Uma2 family endonuclease